MAGCRLGDGPAIDGPDIAPALRQHPRVAGRFLVLPEGDPGKPGDRIEPVQRQDRQTDEIGRQIARFVVGDFMFQGQFPFPRCIVAEEIGRDRNIFVEQAKGERPADRRRFENLDIAMAADQTAVGDDVLAELQIGGQFADEQEPRSPKPQDERNHHPVERSQGAECAALGRRGDKQIGTGRCRHECRYRLNLGRCLERQRWHEQPRHRHDPEQIGDAGAEKMGHRLADCQHQQQQQSHRDHGIPDPLVQFATHFFNSLKSSSISRISSALSSSASARWATNGMTFPPKSRSTKFRDTPVR